jgi:hypothetical protein
MKRFSWIMLGLLFCGGLLAGSYLDAGAQEAKEEAKPELIGSGKCKICHKSEKSGNQYGIWEASKHAQAYTVLGSDEAKAIAKKKDIADPQKAPQCLKCHTAIDFLDEGVKAMDSYSMEEGVGCETCHGPGSEYKSMSVMKDKEKAIAAGLQLHGPDFCVKCHNENSPTYKAFNYEEAWKKIAHPVPKEG